MKATARILLVLLSILALQSNAIALDDNGIAKRAKRMVVFLTKNHLQPRAMNADFGNDLHLLLLDYLDKDKLFFHESDIALLASQTDSLHVEIENERIDYLLSLEKILMQRIQEAKTYISELKTDSSFPLTMTGTLADYDSGPKDSESFNARWKKIIGQRVQDDILSGLGDDETLDSIDLTLRCKESMETVSAQFDSYFDEMLDSDYYLELAYINCIAWCYDPHSNYFNEQHKKEFSEELSSEHEIFGISYQKALGGGIEITGIAPGSSAWYANGIQVGDRLMKITTEGGKTIDADEATPSEISAFFQSLTTDSITLSLDSNGEENDVTLTRSVVYSDADVIKSALLDGDKKVGYISLPDFYTNWTDTSSLGCANDVAKSLLRLQKEGLDGMILDLRDNGGGSIKEAIDLVGIFINYGPVILESDNEQSVYVYKDFHRGSIYRGPLIVLINSSSASASEIVAAALQDYNRGLVVGQKSFGKATGQLILPLDPKVNPMTLSFMKEDPEWGYAKTTQIGLYRLNKGSAQLNGIHPDIELSKMDISDSQYERDLDHAIELDSVVKKIYFTPKPKLPIDAIKRKYSAQKEDRIDHLKRLADSLTIIINLEEAQLSLSKKYEYNREIDILIQRMDVIQEEIQFAYTPISFQFNETILQMSPFLATYNEQFIEQLETDIELNEAYKIMLNIIELKE